MDEVVFVWGPREQKWVELQPSFATPQQKEHVAILRAALVSEEQAKALNPYGYLATIPFIGGADVNNGRLRFYLSPTWNPG